MKLNQIYAIFNYIDRILVGLIMVIIAAIPIVKLTKPYLIKLKTDGERIRFCLLILGMCLLIFGAIFWIVTGERTGFIVGAVGMICVNIWSYYFLIILKMNKQKRRKKWKILI